MSPNSSTFPVNQCSSLLSANIAFSCPTDFRPVPTVGGRTSIANTRIATYDATDAKFIGSLPWEVPWAAAETHFQHPRSKHPISRWDSASARPSPVNLRASRKVCMSLVLPDDALSSRWQCFLQLLAIALPRTGTKAELRTARSPPFSVVTVTAQFSEHGC